MIEGELRGPWAVTTPIDWRAFRRRGPRSRSDLWAWLDFFDLPHEGIWTGAHSIRITGVWRALTAGRLGSFHNALPIMAALHLGLIDNVEIVRVCDSCADLVEYRAVYLSEGWTGRMR